MKNDFDFAVGDIVKYVHEDNEEDKASGYYPPIGTLGTIVSFWDDDFSQGIEVLWDEGTMPGSWWVERGDIVPAKEEDFKHECRKEHRIEKDWKYCPYCGREL